jgi:hypothetical protein
MGRTTTDRVADDDSAPTFVGAELPDHFLDAFVDAELLDAADELAALLEVRRRIERYREGFDR